MLIELKINQFTKLNHTIFKALNWTIHKGENWAIVGDIGTGKTILLQILAGVEYLSLQDGVLKINDNLKKEDFGYISFLDDKKWIKRADFYYQQRYYTSFTDEEMKLQEFLGFSLLEKNQVTYYNSLLLKYQLANLLEIPYIQLSNGQKNKAILIKAFLLDYKVLLFDNPFIGIDVESREDVLNLIDELIQRKKIVIYTSNYHRFANTTTHILELNKQGVPMSIPVEKYPFDNTIQKSRNKTSTRTIINQKIIELENVTIQYHEKKILDQINWEVFEGEKWAIVGKNGSGKSTLLSLLYADHPQAYKNKILLFNEPKHTQSIWEVKSKIGYLSSEFHLHFNMPLNVFETIATGFTDTLSLQGKLNEEQCSSINHALNYFNISSLMQRLFSSLSFGEQRLVLFIRAIIKLPKLLILDEAYQGFDKNTISICNTYIDEILPKETTIVFTSHYQEEMPKCISNFLFLSNGKIVSKN